jgi:hypothetical protein
MFESGRHGMGFRGTAQVRNKDPVGRILLERKHGQGPVERVDVPDRDDEADLTHGATFYSLHR